MAASGTDRRPWALVATCAAALTATVLGLALGPHRVGWESFGFAIAAAVLAQFVVLRFRHGTRTILFAWGEAALIIVVYLLPFGWVPLVIGSGALIGHGLNLLRAGRRWTLTNAGNAANLTLAGVVGAGIAHLLVPQGFDTVTPWLIAALALGSIAYSVAATILVNVVFAPADDNLWHGIRNTFRGKLSMVAGNITIGLAVVGLFGTARAWLLLMPPILVLTHQTYVYRSRASDERRIWREFAEIARSLNQLDERGVAIAAVEGTLRLFNAAAVEVWVDRPAGPARGYRGTSEPKGFELVDLVGTPSLTSTSPNTSRSLAIGGARVGEVRLWMPPGSALEARDQMVLSAVCEALAAALHDASAHRALRTLAARSFHDAHHDVLTGIANRATLMREGTEILRGLPPTVPVRMLVLGINRFKEVNDTLGHTAGDDLLRITASRLAAYVGDGDLIARLTGDEFAILSANIDEHAPAETSLRWANALAEQLAVPTELAGLHLAVEASVGIVVATAGECDTTELVRRADLAMCQAKRGSGPVVVYRPEHVLPVGDETGTDRLSVLVDLREAMKFHDQLVLAVQPAIDLDTGTPIGMEALIRWHHPRRGTLLPADFLDVVNHSDLVTPFTRYVIDHALTLAREWVRDGVPMPVSVNLSPRCLVDPNLPADVAALLDRHGIEPGMLILEITETAVVAGRALVDDVLTGLRALGVQLAVDDFGTGYSSLTFLTRVQVDEVKVDASFVGRMVDSPEAAAIVRTTVDLGRRLGVRVVAEGVETAAQRAALSDLGCGAAQGRHFVAPIGSERAVAVLRELIDGAVPNRVFPLVF